MKHLPFLAAAVLTATAAFSQNATLPKTPLKVGDMAPDFAITANNTSNRAAVKLSDFRGKKNVILAFFPAAFSGG
jgi:mycoredoxin-dependent peroxiredoxin